MTFYQRLEKLCQNQGIKPQNKDFMTFIGVSSGTISNWKKNNAEPEKISTYSKIADYFGVTIDYLAGRMELTNNSQSDITLQEQTLLEVFRNISELDKFEVITLCMELKKKAEKEKTDSSKESAV